MNENKLRRLAYNIWETEGKPYGQEERHWQMALAQAEADEDQYLVGENFLGDSIESGDQSTVGSNREYAALTETEMDTLEAESMNTPQQPVDSNFAAVAKAEKNGKSSGADAQAKSKRRSGKKKSSDNILA